MKKPRGSSAARTLDPWITSQTLLSLSYARPLGDGRTSNSNNGSSRNSISISSNHNVTGGKFGDFSTGVISFNEEVISLRSGAISLRIIMTWAIPLGREMTHGENSIMSRSAQTQAHLCQGRFAPSGTRRASVPNGTLYNNRHLFIFDSGNGQHPVSRKDMVGKRALRRENG